MTKMMIINIITTKDVVIFISILLRGIYGITVRIGVDSCLGDVDYPQIKIRSKKFTEDYS